MSEDLERLPRGLRRALSTARLTGKLGMKAAGRILRKPKDGEPRDKDVDAAIASARELVAKMGALKGLVMKAGQIASYMPGALPPAAAEVLAELQTQSAPMAWDEIAKVLRAELGDHMFDSFDERPFAAASIGQVHRAVLRGTPVAVKIQYPGIEDAIRNDLRMVGVIARLSSLGSPLDGAGLASELRDRLLEECDYTREASNQQLFARLLAATPGASVPAVMIDRTTRRVLTTALVDRTPIAKLAGEGGSSADKVAVRDRAGQIIFASCFELLFHRAVYNADPHPGNYLVAADTGDVTFLDFGCVRRFEPQMIATWKQLARSIIAGNKAGMVDGFRALGFVGKEKGFDWDYQYDAMRFMYSPFLERDFRYTPEFVMKTFGVLMFDNPNRMKIAMPPAWLFLNRLQWGLNAVLAQLHAGGNWRDLIEELLAKPVDPARHTSLDPA